MRLFRVRTLNLRVFIPGVAIRRNCAVGLDLRNGLANSIQKLCGLKPGADGLHLESSTSHLLRIHRAGRFLDRGNHVTEAPIAKGSILLAKIPDFPEMEMALTNKQMFQRGVAALRQFEKGGSRSDRRESAEPASGIPLSLTEPARRFYFLRGRLCLPRFD